MTSTAAGCRRSRAPAPRRWSGVISRSAISRMSTARCRHWSDGDAARAASPPTVTLVAVWIHLLGVVAWIGGVLYQSHVLLPVARSGGGEGVVSAARRARRVTWTAVALVVLSGFYNVTRLG